MWQTQLCLVLKCPCALQNATAHVKKWCILSCAAFPLCAQLSTGSGISSVQRSESPVPPQAALSHGMGGLCSELFHLACWAPSFSPLWPRSYVLAVLSAQKDFPWFSNCSLTGGCCCLCWRGIAPAWQIRVSRSAQPVFRSAFWKLQAVLGTRGNAWLVPGFTPGNRIRICVISAGYGINRAIGCSKVLESVSKNVGVGLDAFLHFRAESSVVCMWWLSSKGHLDVQGINLQTVSIFLDGVFDRKSQKCFQKRTEILTWNRSYGQSCSTCLSIFFGILRTCSYFEHLGCHHCDSGLAAAQFVNCFSHQMSDHTKLVPPCSQVLCQAMINVNIHLLG